MLTAQIEVLPPPPIADANVAGNQFSLTVGSLPPGVGYRVEYKDQLDETVWLPVPPPEQWPSTNAAFTDSPLQAERYYRLKFEYLLE